MELDKKHLGSRIFIKKLGREVEVCEENKSIFIANNFRHLFVMAKPVKTKQVEKPKKKEKKTNKKAEDDSSEPISEQHS